MSKHYSYIRAAVELSRDALYHDFKSCSDGVKITGINIIDVREMTISMNSNQIVVQRVFVAAPDSSGLEKIGWIINDGINECLICSKHFSSTKWRHHCRACGLIVCNSCISKKAYLEGYEELGRKRVCKNCNDQLENVVSLKPNTEWGKSVSARFESKHSSECSSEVPSTTTAAIDSQTQVLKPSPPLDLWQYGPVRVRQVMPRFVFLASKAARSVFINVCSCIYVPRYATNDTLFFVVGSRGRATEDSVDIYDVTVHPGVLDEYNDERNMRLVSRKILSGLLSLGLVDTFSLFYILPESLAYKERLMNETEADTAEMDQLAIAAATTTTTPSGTSSQPSSPKSLQDVLVVAIVMPSLPAFFYHPHIHTTRKDLHPTVVHPPSEWKKFGRIQVDEDGILVPAEERFPYHRHHGVSERQLRRMAQAAERIPELNVASYRGVGGEMHVRGVLHLPVLQGYVVEAPTMCRTLHKPSTPSITNTQFTEANGDSRPNHIAPTVRINLLTHNVVDDLMAMGVVTSGAEEDPPVILCSQPATHTRLDGSTCVTYHVAVQSKYIQEVAEAVGESCEFRVRKIIEKVNSKFHERFIDPSQFALTLLVPSMFQDRDVPLLLYDYPESSSMAVGAFALSPQGPLQMHAAQRAARRGTAGTTSIGQGAIDREDGEAITHGWKVQQAPVSSTPKRSEEGERSAGSKWHWPWKKK